MTEEGSLGPLTARESTLRARLGNIQNPLTAREYTLRARLGNTKRDRFLCGLGIRMVA